MENLRQTLEQTLEAALDVGIDPDLLDAAIRLLDEIDGDTDLEANGDEEPSLGWGFGAGTFLGTDDRELDQYERAVEPPTGYMHMKDPQNPFRGPKLFEPTAR